MGTNFYVAGHQDDDDPQYHLGKRSAAGPYCWDCHITLCKGGQDEIHSSSAEWYSSCPLCGRSPEREPLSESSAGRELGFNRSPPKQKTGVKSCSSFRWARKIDGVQAIVDEYWREYTRYESQEVLDECPIQYWDSLGKTFC